MGIACDSGKAFDPATADLSGTWLYSDSTLFTNPGPPANPCLLRNQQASLTYDSASASYAVIFTNTGTLQCDGGTPAPAIHNPTLFLTQSGDTLLFVNGFHDLAKTGALSSARMMSGVIREAGSNGRSGTWTARRL
jgi:hypothetical protein